MKGLFVDTGGWMACADSADPVCLKAREARDRALERGHLLFTTDYVVDETLTLIRVRLGLDAAEAWWAQIRSSSRLRTEWIGAARADRARYLFFRHRERDFSFTDCTSFIVMQELKLKQALATDGHFQQVGFEVVPVPAKKRKSRH